MLLSDEVIGNGKFNIAKATEFSCPACDSRTHLYLSTYSRVCDGPKCTTTNGKLDSSETILIQCDHIPKCGTSYL